MTQVKCNICECRASHFVTIRIMGRHDAEYCRCTSCGFIFATNPYWLQESFSTELNRLDIGSVDRCLVVSSFVEVVIRSLRLTAGRILDWGGGYGLLTRLLRDRGLDTRFYDPYTSPLFVGDAIAASDENFDLTVMGEVMLHITHPVETLREVLRRSDYLLFTAVVAPPDVSSDWWYFMPDSGQHVAIHSRDSIAALGKVLGVSVTSDGRFFHLLHTREVPRLLRLIFRSRMLAFGLAELFHMRNLAGRAVGRGRSLLISDQQRLIAQLPWNKEDE
jgi:hypothetical protein